MHELEALRKDGMIRHIGLCEISTEKLKQALDVGRVDAVQYEYSLWEREVETDVLPVCRDHNIAFVPYSPLGRGFLTGDIGRAEELPHGDYRRTDPRYQGDNFDANSKIIDALEQVAQRHYATKAQIVLAWLLEQGENVIPIPGTKRRERLEENAKATEVTLSTSDLNSLNEAAPIRGTHGARYNETNFASVRR